MTQEDKELLLKDICARLPYGVKIQVSYEECSGYFDETVCAVDNYESFHINDRCIEYIKPYLFPLSSMTEEQEKEYNNLNCYELGCFPHSEEALDYLTKNHFDYRHLIDKNLAIDATGLNIY